MTGAAAGLPPERFAAKRDMWLVAVLWSASLVDTSVAAWLLFGGDPAPPFVAPLLLAAAAFQLHVLYATDYALDGDTLRIRSSVFRWRVPLAAIRAVERTQNALSSPAPSLDRLAIHYGAKRVMISPADQAGFLRALAQRAPQARLPAATALPTAGS